MINKKIFFSICLFLIISFPINIKANDKIVYLNIDFIINNTNLGKKILKNLNLINESNQKKLSEIEKNIKQKDQELIKIKNIVSKEEIDKKIEVLKKEIKNYNNLKEKMKIELSNTRKNETKIFFEKINPVIESYMDDESIDFIIDQKNIFIARSQYDITEDILKLINTKFK